MAQSGFTPILHYASGTTGHTPLAANLTSSSVNGAELAINYYDGILFYKDSTGTVQVLASKSSTNLASPPPIGSSTPNTGAFTTLSASSTVSGTGFSTYLSSPPAIGSTTANSGAFTTLSASGTVSGTGFSTYLASPPAIGGTTAAAGTFTTLIGATLSVTGSANLSPTGSITISPSVLGAITNMSIGSSNPNTGAFTTLSASSTVSGTGFSTYLASPPAIGGSTAAAGTFTTLTGATLSVSGSATISPAGSVTIHPGAFGSIDNMTVGASAASTGAFTTLSASGAVTHSSTTSLGGLTTYNADALGTYIEVGFRDVPLSANSNPVIADRGKFLYVSANVTVPATTFTAGNAITIVNNSASSITVTFTSATVYLAGTATSGVTRTIAQRGMLTALCAASNVWYVSGAGVT